MVELTGVGAGQYKVGADGCSSCCIVGSTPVMVVARSTVVVLREIGAVQVVRDSDCISAHRPCDWQAGLRSFSADLLARLHHQPGVVWE